MYYFIEFQVTGADGVRRPVSRIIEAAGRTAAGRVARRIGQSELSGGGSRVSFDIGRIRALRAREVPAWKVVFHEMGEGERSSVETVVACSVEEALAKARAKAAAAARMGANLFFTPGDVSFSGRLATS